MIILNISSNRTVKFSTPVKQTKSKQQQKHRHKENIFQLLNKFIDKVKEMVTEL